MLPIVGGWQKPGAATAYDTGIQTFPGFDLQGKGVAVTGAAGHLGSAIALGLAEMGATVVANGRNLDSLVALADRATDLQLLGRIRPIAGDISEKKTVATMLELLDAELGSVDGWVNNAYSAISGDPMNSSRDELDEVVGRGLNDVILATQAAGNSMAPRRSGSIVNIASMYGMVSPQPGVYGDFPSHHSPPAYGAAKAGVIQFSRYAACHLAPDGVRVNSISPGPFPKRSVEQAAPRFCDELRKRVPLGRLGRPDDVAGAAIFLISDASLFVTGHNLVVDGGWTAW